MLTQARLKEILHYDPETGHFFWIKKRRGRVLNKRIGALSGSGYYHITIDYKHHSLHRLAWLFVYGNFPDIDIDHINNIKQDNRIINLRLATDSQNRFNTGINKNNSSGYKGVRFHKQSGKYQCSAMINGCRYHIGSFPSALEASNAYQDFVKQHHGEFLYKIPTTSINELSCLAQEL